MINNTSKIKLQKLVEQFHKNIDFYKNMNKNSNELNNYTKRCIIWIRIL